MSRTFNQTFTRVRKLQVPTIVVSPFARSSNPAVPRINSSLYDHTSVLKFIEWRYNLPPLTSRDASDQIANLALALNFATPDLTVPALQVIRTPFPSLCGLFELGSTVDNESYDFYNLLVSDLAAE